MKRSTLELTALLALLYFALLPFTASFSYTIELPGWLWLAGRFALFYVVLLRLRTYAPIWSNRIEHWFTRLDQDH